jgi:hypothetical protein
MFDRLRQRLAPWRQRLAPWAERARPWTRGAVSVGFWFVAVGNWVVAVLTWLRWPSGAHLSFGFLLTRDLGLRLSGELPRGAHLSVSPWEASLTAPDLPAWLHALTLVPESAVAVAAGAGALLARGIVVSILDGRPFDAGNPGRFGRLAVLVLAAGVVDTRLRDAVAERVLRELAAGGSVPVELVPRQLEVYVAVAAGLLLLAWAFSRGLQVSRDVEGLV